MMMKLKHGGNGQLTTFVDATCGISLKWKMKSLGSDA